MDKHNKTILLVEDSPDDATLALRALKRNDIASDVVIARDGVEAIDYLYSTDPATGKPKNKLPALILLDLKLPKIDGLEVLARVRANARTRLLMVVVLTSSNEEKDIRECYRVGANSYIRKPVDFREFTQAVRQIGDYWLTLNQSPPAGA